MTENTTDDETDSAAITQEQLVMMAATASNLVARRQMANRMGEQFGGDRDLFEALGYPDTIVYRDYKDWYDRGGIAKTVIDMPVETTWREQPDVVDDKDTGEEASTDFEEEVQKLFDADENSTNLERGLRHYLERVDKLGRLGRFSVLFLGLADVEEAKQLKNPVNPNELDGLDDLLYLTPLGEDDADINTWVTDVTDPRNGYPETYDLDLANGDRVDSHVVHHSRVIHVAEGILEDEIYGEPAMRPIMHRLFDKEKIQGSAAEAYWMVSNPGLAISIDPELADVDTDNFDEQVDEYEHNMRRVLKAYGMDAEQLEAQDVDPEAAIDSILKEIAGTVRIPKRKLTGSERGDLASTQDQASYLDTISSRQTRFDEPVLLRPTIDRLRNFGILSQPAGGSYSIEWPTLFQLTDLERAELKKTLAQAVKAVAPMGDVEILHSIDALREFSPIDEGEDTPAPEELPDIDEEIDEEDEQVQDIFEDMQVGAVDLAADLAADGGKEMNE